MSHHTSHITDSLVTVTNSFIRTTEYLIFGGGVLSYVHFLWSLVTESFPRGDAAGSMTSLDNVRLTESGSSPSHIRCSPLFGRTTNISLMFLTIVIYMFLRIVIYIENCCCAFASKLSLWYISFSRVLVWRNRQI